jgi:hypothetical protein
MYRVQNFIGMVGGRCGFAAASILTVLLLADTASACNRCGLFGLRCRFSKQAVVKQVKQFAAYQQPANVTNVSIVNAYPVGATQYASVQSATSLYAVSPAIALTAATETATRSLATMQTAIESITSNNRDMVELAKLQAARDHLQTALATSQESHSYTLRITQSGGGVQVEKLQDRLVGSGNGGPEKPFAPGSLLDVKCAKCHGVDLAEPKAGLWFGSTEPLEATQAVRALRVLDGLDVPPEMTSLVESLSTDELSQLRSEILSKWSKP